MAISRNQLSKIQQLVEADVEKWGENIREASLRLHYARALVSLKSSTVALAATLDKLEQTTCKTEATP